MCGRRKGGRGEGEKKEREEENTREWDAQEGRSERERNERDSLTEVVIKGLTRNMALRKFPESTRMTQLSL